MNVFEKSEVKESQRIPNYSILGASFPVPLPSLNLQQASYR